MKPKPLVIIAVLFGAAFVGRAISVADAALNAYEPAPKEPAGPAHPPAAIVPKQSEPHAPTPYEPASIETDVAEILDAKTPAEKSKLLNAIRTRTADLDRRETAIEDKARALEIIEGRIDEKLTELKKRQEALASLVSYADEASQSDIELLARMYEQMKPQKAGEIFDKMDPVFAAGFLTQMNSENAALILMNMSTDKAYQTSMIIASRNAAVRTQ